MSFGMNDFWAGLRDSIFRPREVTRRLLATEISAVWLWQALLLLSILAGLLAWVELVLLPAQDSSIDTSRLPGPVAMSAMQFGLLSILVPVLQGAGRAFGGKGDLHGAMKVVVWWQGLTLALQVGELLALALLPPLSVLIIIATFGAMVWALTNAVAELHGFQSLGLTLLGMIAVAAVMVVALSLLMAALGVAPIGVS